MTYPNVVYAIHNFEAENEDEIAFNYGEPIIILEKDDQFMDGWWQGRNIQGDIGLFPMNYTSPDKPGMNRVTSVYTSKDMYNDRNSINTGVFRRKSGSTVSSRGTSSTERSVSKEDAVIGDFGQSHICPLFWNTNDVIMWLEYAGLDMAIDHFIGQEVTGDVLLDLTHDGLKELGITAYGRRYRIINSIDGLRRFVESINSSKVNLPSSRRGSIPENQSSVNVVTCLNSTISSKQGSPKEYTSEDSLSYSSSLYRSSIHSPKSIRPQSQDNMSILSPRSNTNTISTRRSAISIDQASSRNTSISRASHTSIMIAQDAPPTPPVPALEDRTEHEGWLHKRSDRFKTWNKRWFILRDSSLFYFKNPKDNKMKGIICLQGYRVIADASTTGNKRFGFKLYHDRERVFQFYTDTADELKKWMQALMKTTIKRDLCAPVVSSNNMSTVSLDIAQKMRPRPPSMLMYKTNFEKQMHEMNTGEHPEEKADETFMWMEDTLKEDTANQTIIKAYPDNEEAIDTKNSSFSTSEEEEEEEEDRPWYEVNLIEWSNSHLQSTKIDDLSESFRSGKILIELLESVSGQTISKDTNTPDNNIAEAFQFMADIGVEENEYSAQDVLTGNEDKIIDMLISIKEWAEANEE